MAAHSAAMMLSDLVQYVPMVLFLMTMGAVAGFFSGLLGIGGGLILVPGLYFGLSAMGYEQTYLMHVAIGTSLAAILPTGFSSARAHWKRGAVRMDIFRAIAPGTMIGSLAGVVTAGHVTGAGLQIVFGAAVLLVAVVMFVDPARYRFLKDVPQQPVIFFIGIFVGILAALMGIAGALLCVPFLVMCGVAMHAAVGTSSAIGLTVSFPAAVGFIFIGMAQDTGIPLTLGYVNMLAFALIIPFSVLVAPLGAKVAHSMDVGKLRKVFAVFMVLIAAKMLWGSFGG
jgi:uncharacterized membrane protein YfcA